MIDETRAREIIDLALQSAEGDEADVTLFATDRNISRFANSSLRQNMSEESAHLSLRVVVDRRIGVAATSSLTAEDIANTAQIARTLALQNEPLDDFPGLYNAHEAVEALDTWDEQTAAADLTEKASQLKQVFDRGRNHDISFAGTYTTAASSVAAGNSHGIRRFSRITLADAMFIALAGKTSGFATEMSRRIGALDIRALGDEAIERARLFAPEERELEPGDYDVILEPAALAEIFEWMNMVSFSGRSYDDGSSFFVDHLGQSLLGSNCTIADDAVDRDFLPFPFDMEGRPKKRVELISSGTLQTPMLDTWFAHRLGLAPTGSAVDLSSDDHGMALHISLSAGDSSREEMISSSERAIWVTRFHYINGLLEPRVALMTGMTRDGTFLIENGKVTARLANLRWTQSMTEAFSNITALSRDRRAVGTWWNPIGGTFAPVVKIRNWKFTGVQKK